MNELTMAGKAAENVKIYVNLCGSRCNKMVGNK